MRKHLKWTLAGLATAAALGGLLAWWLLANKPDFRVNQAPPRGGPVASSTTAVAPPIAIGEGAFLNAAGQVEPCLTAAQLAPHKGLWMHERMARGLESRELLLAAVVEIDGSGQPNWTDWSSGGGGLCLASLGGRLYDHGVILPLDIPHDIQHGVSHQRPNGPYVRVADTFAWKDTYRFIFDKLFRNECYVVEGSDESWCFTNGLVAINGRAIPGSELKITSDDVPKYGLPLGSVQDPDKLMLLVPTFDGWAGYFDDWTNSDDRAPSGPGVREPDFVLRRIARPLK